jgi:hypothetical protein
VTDDGHAVDVAELSCGDLRIESRERFRVDPDGLRRRSRPVRLLRFDGEGEE